MGLKRKLISQEIIFCQLPKKVFQCSTEEAEIFLDYINYCFYSLNSILVNNISVSVFLTIVEE